MKQIQIPVILRPASSRRQLLLAGCAAAIASTLPMQTWAQSDFPNRQIRIVVPYSPGTGSDVLARTIAQSITEKTGKSVIIENKEGAGSLIGTQEVARSAPDGYTILIAANPLVIVPSQKAAPPYDPVKDFVPVAKVAVIPLVLAVSPALNINSVKELMAHAKANPGKLSYGSSGPGTISQQEMELFKQAASLEIQEIPYKSTAQAMTDLIGGNLPLFPAVVPLVAPHIQSGRAKAIAVLDNQRSQLLPDVPAITEGGGIPGYVPTPVWYAFVAPAKTPEAVINVLNGYITTAMASPDVKTKLAGLGATPVSVTNAQFAADLKAEYEKAGALAKKLGSYK
ncbi:Bug family tripartite tricarboxylate transporter substrate binding protein [Piscinibacter sakaiensis]|uniref:Bug family tripartite tricarboxylate transporter substrate binding protein n=1 Tax=Piscinibacter sakaiensis TaxID=1547922 RepID=UPI003AADF543